MESPDCRAMTDDELVEDSIETGTGEEPRRER